MHAHQKRVRESETKKKHILLDLIATRGYAGEKQDGNQKREESIAQKKSRMVCVRVL